MKKILLYNLAIFSSALMLSSCIGDLDALPLNETDKSAEQAYQTYDDYEKGLAYIYGSYSLVSQNDPGSSDISVKDAGQSELVRQYVVLNEMSADALKCTWGDSYITETQSASWTSASNSATVAVYTRAMVTITRANEFLVQSSGKSIEGIAQLRAEARFLRAYAYYMMMDLYGNPPFATEEILLNGGLPTQIKRADLFNWLETELVDLIGGEEQLASTGELPYPRVTKDAAKALLARIYLNAEVYTGQARWQEALDAAEEVIQMKGGDSSLCSNYQHLFLQDNGENADAYKEFIFGISYDRDFTQSWGGTTHLMSGAMDDKNNNAIAAFLGYPEGSRICVENWNGYHVPDEYVQFFELQGVTWGAKWEYESGNPDKPWQSVGIGYDRANSDKRAFFTNVGSTQEFSLSDASTGWRCWKFPDFDSKGTLYTAEGSSLFSSTDFPMIRLAEMYLIYAEAKARLDGGVTTDTKAKAYIKALRDRAGVSMPVSISTDFVLEERARELMWEGHRRTDLIRYGYFTSMQFAWPYKGGIPDGKVAIPSYRTIYPLLASDVAANPNLVQNPGY